MSRAQFKTETGTLPVKSVNVRSRDFDYGSFSTSVIGTADKNVTEDCSHEDLYIYLIRHISDIIDNDFRKTPVETANELVSCLQQCERFPVLQRMLTEWICDFCLINGELFYLGQLFRKDLKKASLAKDFLIGDFLECFPFADMEKSVEKLNFALVYLCDYNYSMSVHYRENTELYDKVLCVAVACVLNKAAEEMGEDFIKLSVRRAERVAYRGLTCKSEKARIIEIEYIPYSENAELSALVTAAVKYADNLIRQGLGIKSKIPNVGLAPEFRVPLTEAVRKAVPGLLPMPAKVGRKPKPENEKKRRKRYEEETSEKIQPLDLNIDFSRAKKLEAESWKLAELVGGDYDGAQIDFSAEVYDTEDAKDVNSEEAFADNTKMDSAEKTQNFGEWTEFFAALSEDEIKILKCILCGDDITALSKSLGGMAHGFADSINEKAQDTYGDVIIDTDDDGEFCVFSDYADELSEIINDNMEVL